MKSGRIIDISKSSLVSLKAELSRKQEEVDKVKSDNQTYVRPTPRLRKSPPRNSGVDERNARDLTLDEGERDKLKISRDVLELKAKLYDQLQKGDLVQEKGKSEYLVDFSRKVYEERERYEEEEEAEEPPPPDDKDDSDWVDYIDCLGRTRRCLRADLPDFKSKDKDLALSLFGEDFQWEEPEVVDLLQENKHKEELRKKWEQKEEENARKEKIFYEDVRYDEARTHGVGYFKFSTDEAQREKEQEVFKKVRQETMKRQEEAKALRERRERQKQARLMAARQRQRQRLGLPPIEFSAENPEPPPGEEAEEEEKTEEETKDKLEAQLKRAAHVRPWDLGKSGVFEPKMTQEEYVEQMRDKRISEFAPAYRDEVRRKKTYEPEPRRRSPEPEPRRRSPEPTFRRNISPQPPPRRGAEIPPPMSFEYFTPNKRSRTRDASNAEDAIEAGLAFLRQQTEAKATTSRESKLRDEDIM